MLGEVKRRGWRCYVTLTALRNVLAVCGWGKGVDYQPSSISACRPMQPRDPAQHTYGLLQSNPYLSHFILMLQVQACKLGEDVYTAIQDRWEGREIRNTLCRKTPKGLIHDSQWTVKRIKLHETQLPQALINKAGFNVLWVTALTHKIHFICRLSYRSHTFSAKDSK